MSDTMPTVCHFCGSKVTILSDGSECKANDGSWIWFQCGTGWQRGYHDPSQLQSRRCEIAERDMLKSRIKRLEEFTKTIENDFDHDEDAHRYGTMCRVCDAAELLRETKIKEAKP